MEGVETKRSCTLGAFRLLWAGVGPDGSIDDSRRGKVDAASLDDVTRCLDGILGRSGLVELVLTAPSETGPRGMQLRTEESRSIITLAEVDSKQENNIRTYRQGKDGEDVEILGGRWKAQLVCNDDELVKQAFTEFFTTGDVSRELLH